MESLAKDASEAGRTNVAFVCNYLLGHTSECLNLLVETGRTPEAAFFARTYAPSQVSRMVELWKEDLTKVNEKAAESLADPAEYPNLFQDFDLGLIAEHQACVCVCVCILPLLAQQYLLTTGAKVQILTQMGVAGV
jgi:coatomer subunit beta'